MRKEKGLDSQLDNQTSFCSILINPCGNAEIVHVLMSVPFLAVMEARITTQEVRSHIIENELKISAVLELTIIAGTLQKLDSARPTKVLKLKTEDYFIKINHI